MDLNEFINYLNTLPATQLARQKDIRKLAFHLSDEDRDKIRRTIIAGLSSHTNLNIKANATRIYAALFGKKDIDFYAEIIKKSYPEDYTALLHDGLIKDVTSKNVQQQLGDEYLWNDWAEMSYIKSNLIHLFPGRVYLAKQLLIQLNSLNSDELFLACHCISELCYEKNLLGTFHINKILTRIKCIRQFTDSSLDLTKNLTSFFDSLRDKGLQFGHFQFKIILLSNLLLSSRIYSLTDYQYMCPINPSDDVIMSVTIEQSILQHLYAMSDDHDLLNLIFKYNHPNGNHSLSKVVKIIEEIDNTNIESSYKKRIKREEKKNRESSQVNTMISDSNEKQYIAISKVYISNHEIFYDAHDSINKPVYVNLRPKQQIFRASVFENYGKQCAVCGIDIEELLEAAHIVSKKDGGMDTFENGLPLCALHHKAYDAHLFCIYPDNFEIIPLPDGPSLDDLLITKTNLNYQNKFPNKHMVAWRWNQWVDVITAPK